MSVAYLEDFHLVKIITEQFDKNTVIEFINSDAHLTLLNKQTVGKEQHLFYTTDLQLALNVDYKIKVNDEEISLFLGKVTRSKDFDQKYFYDGPLGFEYHKKYTIFRIWSPVSKEIKLVLPFNNQIYDMNYREKGLWEVKVKGNLNRKAYYFLTRINDTYVRTLDPYGISNSLKEDVNYVIDLEKTYKMKVNNWVFKDNYNNAIIMEAHLKDLTNHLEGSSNYLNAIQMIDYFKDLGITHLQILPVNSFYGVDDENKDDFYNWGYNPLEYMTLTGWYSSNPNDPYLKINEFKKMVDSYHLHGLSINLDVVFNHVYKHNMFSYGKLVPGYAFRCDDNGFLTNGSFCGNDLATERLMIRKLIVDTCKFYTTFYHIDGFRFDLMGLIDIETIRKIEEELRKINPHIMLYGEGWHMNTGLDSKLLASNKGSLPSIAYFNGEFRDILRGNPFKLEKCILTGSKMNQDKITYLLKGSSNFMQAINYLECHDNYTLNDQMDLVKKLTLNEKQDYLKLAIGLIMISQGIPFFHLGMELGRTKQGIGNSYKSDMTINQVNWQNQIKYQEVIDYFKKMVKLRKTHKVFTLDNQNIINDLIKPQNINGNCLYYLIQDFEVIITNTYDAFEFNQTLINKPGVYLFQNKKPIL